MESKKYFTRYLPVEGEIITGDKAAYYGTDKLHPPIGTLIDIVDDVHGSIMEDKLWKKVKLFLCSRDIKVGDKFFDTRFLGEEFEVETLYHLQKLKDGIRFKIIGEISPEALSYVKEGDEFDESQWRNKWYNLEYGFFTRHIWKPSDEYTNLGESRRAGKMFIYVQIQCSSCGHFH